jgi:gamma-glutamylcyclotransferase (GGCT)/AIG2-like uncharacterized protein YtfP
MVTSNLFVYGSLMSEEVLQVLLGRVPACAAASLGGFVRYSIRGKQYPIIAKTNKQDVVKGKLLYGINPQEVRVLDLFEGDEYVRTDVIAQTEDGKQINAATYVATTNAFETLKPHLSNEWSYEQFRDNHLQSFLNMCTKFKDDGYVFG